MASLSGKLPKGDRNGLADLEARFVKNPTQQHVVFAIIDVAKITDNVDTGDVEPTLRILRVERILPGDAKVAEQLIRRSLEVRTGISTLPLELENEITAVFLDLAEAAVEPEEPGESPAS